MTEYYPVHTTYYVVPTAYSSPYMGAHYPCRADAETALARLISTPLYIEMIQKEPVAWMPWIAEVHHPARIMSDLDWERIGNSRDKLVRKGF